MLKTRALDKFDRKKSVKSNKKSYENKFSNQQRDESFLPCEDFIEQTRNIYSWKGFRVVNVFY